MELPKPESVNFYEMSHAEQNRYYAKNVRKLIEWLLLQDDFPDKFRRAVEAIDDYTFYIGEEIGVRQLVEDEYFCNDPECGCDNCDGDCDCVEESVDDFEDDDLLDESLFEENDED